MKRTYWMTGMALLLYPLLSTVQADPVHDWLPDALGPLENQMESAHEPWYDSLDLTIDPTATPSPDWVNVLGIDFRGYSSGFKYGTFTHASLVCQSGTTTHTASARLDIPHKRKITHFRLWGYDNLASGDLSATLWRACLPEVAAAPAPSVTALATVKSNGTPTDFTVVADLNPAHVVNAHLCTYWASVDFDQCSSAESLRLQVRKIHVEHRK